MRLLRRIFKDVLLTHRSTATNAQDIMLITADPDVMVYSVRDSGGECWENLLGALGARGAFS